MIHRRKVRDNALIDALEASSATEFAGHVWRVVRAGRDPIRGSSPAGRWDDGTFDVLYTSTESDGAVAEMYFHVMRGQSIFPSEMEFHLYELDIVLQRALRLADMEALRSLGVNTSNYGSLEYAQKHEEYPQMQQIGEAAHFLDFDGILVPNARWECENVVLFTDRVPPDALSIFKRHGVVDWIAWKKESENQ